MKRGVASFLQIMVVLTGIVVLVALLWEPRVEGVNANATSLYQIYFDDPFLAYIYFSFIAVFVGFYQTFKLLGFVGSDETYSQRSVQALRTIRYCALTFAGLIFLAVAYIMIIASRTSDDIAGGVAVGLFMIVVSLAIAATTWMFERILQKVTAQTP